MIHSVSHYHYYRLFLNSVQPQLTTDEPEGRSRLKQKIKKSNMKLSWDGIERILGGRRKRMRASSRAFTSWRATFRGVVARELVQGLLADSAAVDII